MKKFIPNFVTLLNLFSGSIAVLFAVYNNFVAAAIFVFLGIFFDFFDGLLARKLNVQSDLGIQLDSLADMVTSGLVPGIVMFKLLAISLDTEELSTAKEWSSDFEFSSVHMPVLALSGLFITLASAYRLAKFNIDEDQQTYFKGLPTPANALLILSLPLILEFQNSNLITEIIINPWFLIILTLLSCYLLNADIKLFALKFKDYSFKRNVVRYGFIMFTLVMVVLFQFIAIPIVILGYFLTSMLFKSLTAE
ncbi:phosphatidylserine synthase [Subsaximicrobium wynnwilliamsii]|uniref:Phosphatidylserine synthase n=1 Tax=Subsaximicrobium wynnwilliamsii TaxID=291179 RepID=A0A5C6ZF82_9FLAO|nr:CDP-alcohol phosphatidyltransferase family protein [Subsaximicrobium wynnwilliamsii]TXD81673.1 phosphatidylserine synthase [Subsaximicrobium wynnwilliamsii]TXD87428.1 phosphatidylserine synthase [Subsaximicrobium wynnwilliamsii]TXE01116.1 phosphatidylserine synthase [Subsaximicrobium wynnwilliamsii]